MTEPFDVDLLRSDFPALAHGLAYFDGPGGTQTPRRVAAAMAETLTSPLSNKGNASLPQRNATAAVESFRLAMADLLDAPRSGIVYGRSATALTYEISRAMAKGWTQGDEVVVTRLDHDGNVRPWVQAAEAVGATIRWADFEPDSSELPVEAVARHINPRTKLVAVTGASNLLGTMPDIKAIADVAHASGALVYVDAVHAAAHRLLSLRELGADFLVCSPYKFLGPHCGVLAAAPELLDTLRPDKLKPAPDEVPERFEHGTHPYEVMAGVAAAVDYLAAVSPDAQGSRRARLGASFAAIEAHEDRLRRRIEDEVGALPAVKSWSLAARRTPTLLFTFAGAPAAQVSQALAEVGVLAPSGNFYALEAALHMGLGITGGLRVGLAPYNNDEDVDRLVAALSKVIG
ncbi:MAG TPA: cysteine desulfurase-like protein [Trueperaceae bacterium]|nr:cysteine desulfurase-like protein [Trueperaceae bacterium]